MEITVDRSVYWLKELSTVCKQRDISVPRQHHADTEIGETGVPLKQKHT